MPAAWTVVLAAALAAGAYAGDVVLAAGVLAVQGLVIFGWHRALAVPGTLGGVVLAGVVAAAADVLLLVLDEERPLTPLTGLLGLAMVGALVHQLVRRPDRHRLTASLTATCMLVVLVALAAFFVAAEETRGGSALVASAATAAAVAAAANPLRAPALILAGVATVGGAIVGAAVAGLTDLSLGTGVLVGSATAATAMAMLAFVRRLERAHPATAGALPLTVVAPIAYVLGRILVG